MVTVAVRRINIFDKKKPILTDYLDPKKIKVFRKIKLSSKQLAAFPESKHFLRLIQ